ALSPQEKVKKDRLIRTNTKRKKLILFSMHNYIKVLSRFVFYFLRNNHFQFFHYFSFPFGRHIGGHESHLISTRLIIDISVLFQYRLYPAFDALGSVRAEVDTVLARNRWGHRPHGCGKRHAIWEAICPKPQPGRRSYRAS